MAQIEGNVKINVNANQADHELQALKKRSEELRREIIKLNKEEVLDNKKLKSLNSELKQIERQEKQIEKTARSYKRTLDNLSGASMKDLYKISKQLSYELNSLKRNTIEWKQKAEQLSKVKSEIDTTKNKMKQLNQTANESRTGFHKLADGFNKFGGIITAVAAGAVASIMGIKNVFTKLSTTIVDFEDTFTNVLTLLSSDQINKFGSSLEQGAISTMRKFGLEITDVNKALFDTISAGVDAATAIDVLDAAAILATAGATDLTTATDGLTTTINAFGLSTAEAEDVANAFFSAQKFGKTTVAELAQNFGKLAPILNNVGVSYQEGLSLLAELTKKGIGTAEATTYLKAAFSSLLKPGADAEKILSQYNVPVGIAEIQSAGLTNTLNALNNMILQNPNAIAKAIPSVEGMTAILALSGDTMQDFSNILQNVNTDIGDSSSMMNAFGIKSDSTAFRIKQQQAEIKTLTLELRDYLVPVINAVLKITSSFSNQLIKLTHETNAFTTALKDVSSGSREMTDTLVDGVIDTNKITADKLTDGVKTANRKLLEFFNNVWNKFVEIEKIFMKPYNAVLKIMIALYKVVGRFFQSTKKDADDANSTLGKFVNFFQWLKVNVGNIFSPIINGFKSITSEIGKAVDKIVEFLNGIQKIEDNVRNISRKTSILGDTGTRDAKNNSGFSRGRQNMSSANRNGNINNDIIDMVGLDVIDMPIEPNEKNFQQIKDNEAELAEYIRDMRKQLLVDEQARQIEELKIWKENEDKKINEWVAAEENKNQALILIEEQYNRKVQEIQDNYNKMRVQKMEEITDFLTEQELKLSGTREQILQSEEEKIRNSYDQRIVLALQMAEKEDAYAELFRTKAEELRIQREEAVYQFRLDEEEKFQQKLLQTRQQYGLVSEQERMNLELQQVEDLYSEKLLNEEDYQDAKQKIIDQYQQAELQKTLDLEAKKKQAQTDSLNNSLAIIDTFGNYFASAKETELQIAGDNEEEKKKIMQKYAEIEMYVNFSKIIASTALAVMQAYAQLGPVAGSIAAVFIAGTGAAQAAIAMEQRNKIQGFEDGGKIPVVRQQDNKFFSATPTEKRGILSKPSVLVAENGPEYVVPTEGLENPSIMNFLMMMESARLAGQLRTFRFPKTTGFEEGGATMQIQTSQNSTDIIAEKLDVMIYEFLKFKNEVTKWQRELYVNYSSFEEAEEKITAVQTKANIK